ncbi:MmcQ/YjbR family DNA-binding protein [Anaerolineae bacterium CFX8]|nr:MmcQ/YjbR family DNA-binding protein [Anaerolineae bacterium CFX8]
MDRNELRLYCLSRRAAVEDFPFGDDVAVFKVAGRVFALLPAAGPVRISLKCDPTWAVVLRQTYPAVKPGWHLNKKHWNTVEVDGSIADDEILEMVEHSYQLVVKGLTKAERACLEES